MRCAVPTCDLDSDCTTEDVAFHSFPTDTSLRAMWLKMLNRKACWQLTENSGVCSKHFLKGDLYLSRSGQCRVREGALPVVNVQITHRAELCDVKVCRICFATDCNLYKMTECYNLDQAYLTLTGLSIEEEDDLPPYLCIECAQRLINCVRFRSRSLRAHLVLLEAVKKYGCVTLQSIKSVIGNENLLGTQLGVKHNETDHYDLEIHQAKDDNIIISTDEQVDLMDTADTIKVEHDEMDLYIGDNDPISEATNDHLPMHKQYHTKMDSVHNQNITDEDAANEMQCSLSSTADTNVKGLAATEVGIKESIVNRQDISLTDRLKQVNQSPSEYYRTRFLLAQRVITRSVATRAKVTEMPEDQSLAAVPSDHARTKIVKLRKPIANVKANVKLPYGFYRTVNDVPKWNYIKVMRPPASFCCHMCNFKAATRTQLTAHVKTHTFLQCLYLETSCQSVLTEHSGEIFRCSVCGQVFSDKDNLHSHMIMTAGGKPYTCDVCKRKFKTKSDIEKHLRMHTGAKPYCCELCGKKFNYKISLRAHKRKVHSTAMKTVFV